ncbi:hypothetical protein O0L34_g12486 [Tuta absoluta]|nr:hypothetical protein O0L34_g12486 [Tuta absoluta]
MSVWVFLNLLCFGMCGYLYLIWSQYWMYIEKQRLFNKAPATERSSLTGLSFEKKFSYNAAYNASTLRMDSVRKRSAIGSFWSNGKPGASNNVVRKDGSPRFPNIHKPVLEFDSEKYLCDDLYSSDCQTRSAEFKDVLLKEFHRVLMGESKVFRSGLDVHNTYNVKYDRKPGKEMSRLEAMCLDVKRKVNDYYEIWSDSRPERNDIKLHSGFYYHGDSALEHQIGDLRVHFSYAGREDDIYTAVGVVESGILQAYSPSNFPYADPISLLRKGSFSLSQLYNLEKRDANIHTWKYRALGLVQVYASAMTLHPDWLTIFLQLQWVSSSLRRCSRMWANLVLAFSYTLLVISIPWLVHKPSFGALVLGGAILPLLHYSTILSRRDDTSAPHPPHPR